MHIRTHVQPVGNTTLHYLLTGSMKHGSSHTARSLSLEKHNNLGCGPHCFLFVCFMCDRACPLTVFFFSFFFLCYCCFCSFVRPPPLLLSIYAEWQSSTWAFFFPVIETRGDTFFAVVGPFLSEKLGYCVDLCVLCHPFPPSLFVLKTDTVTVWASFVVASHLFFLRYLQFLQ